MITLIEDPHLGQIELKRFKNSRSIRIKLRHDGTVYITMPPRTPLFTVQKFLNNSKAELLKAQQENQHTLSVKYFDQQQVGASHKIILNHQSEQLKAYSVGQIIRWLVPEKVHPQSKEAQEILRPVVRKVLDRQAKAYLPRQLQYLADKYNFTYSKVRFGNAKGRWGSCSSQGVITLNVALMNLPSEVIDYVLIHELCHTVELNHSREFWDLVEGCLPNYKIHRQNIKKYSPYL